MGENILSNSNQDTIIRDYFNRKVRSILNDLAPIVYQEQQKIAEEHNSRGVLSSGMVAGAILEMIRENILNSCREALKLIDLFQREKNVEFTDDQLNIIKEIYQSYYNDCFLSMIEKVYFANVKRYIGEEMAKSIASQIITNNTTNMIFNLVNDKVEDIKVHNLVQRDEPSVEYAKKAYSLSIFALIIPSVIGIAAIIFSIIYR